MPTIEVGTQIPPVVRQPDEKALFLFSAATWNAHRIHYDRDQARVEGHADLVVQGTMQGAWLGDLVTTWAGARGVIRRLRFRNVGTAYVNQRLTVSGKVTRVSPRTDGDGVDVECDLWVSGPGGTTTEGWALVAMVADEAGGRS